MTEYTYDVNTTRLGQKNLSGDTLALFKDNFCPELITQFDTNRVMKNYVRSKTITKGKSASFPVLGTTTAQYFDVGDKPLLGNQTIAHGEITIHVDPYLVWSIMLAEIDEKMQEYDDRAEIVAEGGRALANTEDKQLLQVGVLAARSEAFVQGGNGGSVIKAGATAETDAATLAASIYSAGVIFDEKNIPDSDRNVFVKPLQYSLLCQYENIADKNIGGGSYENGTTGKLDNFKIIKTNHLPTTNITYAADKTNPRNIYYGDFTNTVALCMHKGAVGTVSLLSLTTEIDWKLEFLQHLIVSRILQGHGILRPDCAIEISKAAA